MKCNTPNETHVLNSLVDWKKFKDLSDIKIESEDGRLFYCPGEKLALKILVLA